MDSCQEVELWVRWEKLGFFDPFRQFEHEMSLASKANTRRVCGIIDYNLLYHTHAICIIMPHFRTSG